MFTSLIKFFLDPFNILWLLLFVTAVAYFVKRELLLRRLILISGGWFLLVTTPILPTTLVNSLEDQYDPVEVAELNDPGSEYHIIVLGGGHSFDERLPANSLLSSNALGRLNEGIRLHRQLPNSKLLLSGYSSSGRTSQAEMLRNAAFVLGVEEEAMILQTEPGNTYEEAEVYASGYGGRHPVILVTSAIHMPRAMMMFRKFEIRPIASPTNYRLKGSWKEKHFGLPSTGNIRNLNASLNEYAGIFQARYLL